MDGQLTSLFEFSVLLVIPFFATIVTFVYRYFTDDVIYREEAETKAQARGWGVYGVPQPHKIDKKRPRAALLRSAACRHECFGYYCGVRH
ncbi:MAG: hypothetical protein ACRD3W_04125 [Terriglobales bacterium]